MKNPSLSMWRERLRAPLTLHLAGLSALAIVAVVLIVKICMDWAAAAAITNRVEPADKSELAALTMTAVSLQGLDKRIASTQDQINTFLSQRIPASYSSVAARIGELEVQSGVRLSNVQYSQGHPGTVLTEMSIDTAVSGEYPQIMHFVNALERDQSFFVVRAMGLDGQQGGQVNLRLRFSTWLRAEEAASLGLPATPTQNPAVISNRKE